MPGVGVWRFIFPLCKNIEGEGEGGRKIGNEGELKGLYGAVGRRERQKKSECAVSGMYKGLQRGEGGCTGAGQQASAGRPRALPSQTDSRVFDRNCSGGPLAHESCFINW